MDKNGNPDPTKTTNRKRGHQHHIRNSGTRRSNVPADEIIAALRSGDQLPVTQNILQFDKDSDGLSDIELAVDTDNNNLMTHNTLVSRRPPDELIASAGNNTANHPDTLIDNIRLDSTASNIEQPKQHSNVLDLSESNCKKLMQTSTASSDFDMDTKEDDSISSNSSSNKKPRKSKRSDAKKREKRSKNLPPPPNEERPPLEGAPADQGMDEMFGDIDDPETAEWSKLRCTSERTEVVAEREYRRQNRRCADYPGLAFGRSIFSSDTMMKLNIIRNELHNIMKTQLKRVRVLRQVEREG